MVGSEGTDALGIFMVRKSRLVRIDCGDHLEGVCVADKFSELGIGKPVGVRITVRASSPAACFSAISSSM